MGNPCAEISGSNVNERLKEIKECCDSKGGNYTEGALGSFTCVDKDGKNWQVDDMTGEAGGAAMFQVNFWTF